MHSCQNRNEKTRRIYIDLDNTLIDSAYRYAEEIKIAKKYGIPEDEYKAVGQELRSSSEMRGYNFRQIFEYLAEQKPGLSSSFYEELDALLDRQYPFPDAEEFLSSFPKNELVILTQGNRETQQRKIYAHRFHEFVEKVEIVSGGGKPQAIIPEPQTFFLDDTPGQIDLVKSAHASAVWCVQVRTPPPWETQTESLLKDAHLPSLSAAIEYIHKNS